MTASKVIASQESHNVKIWHTMILHTLSGTIYNLYIKNNPRVGEEEKEEGSRDRTAEEPQSVNYRVQGWWREDRREGGREEVFRVLTAIKWAESVLADM